MIYDTNDVLIFISIDMFLLFLQYNSWFTFSEYEEPVTMRSTRPVHAREVTMVSITY